MTLSAAHPRQHSPCGHSQNYCKETDDYRTQSLFIKYQYSYMFRPREVVIRLALEHFKRNVQIALLEIISHFFIGAVAPPPPDGPGPPHSRDF